MSSRTILASEVAEFVFCQRAWWYRRQGEPSANVAALRAGGAWHASHGREVLAAGCLRALGYASLLAAVVAAAAYLTAIALR